MCRLERAAHAVDLERQRRRRWRQRQHLKPQQKQPLSQQQKDMLESQQEEPLKPQEREQIEPQQLRPRRRHHLQLPWLVVALVVAADQAQVSRALANPASFNRRFDRCAKDQTESSDPLTRGQTLPTGMTLHSLIDKIEAFERRVFPHGASAERTALTLLHWFALPDLLFVTLRQGYAQGRAGTIRYNFISRLFSNELSKVADEDFEQKLLVSDDFRDEDRNDLCFLMFALSHQINSTCNTNYDWSDDRDERNSLLVKRKAMDNQNLAEQAGVPNVRPHQRQPIAGNRRPQPAHRDRQPPSGSLACTYSELGVVSITGRPQDAIAMAPVLMGIAASGADDAAVPLFPESSPELVRKDHSDVGMDVLVMGTLGQEVGMAAFARKCQELFKAFRLMKPGTYGRWNRSGCLTSYEYHMPESSVITATGPQVAGALDGLIIGTILKKNRAAGLDRMSLAALLRMYYSNNQVPVQLRSFRGRFSVCDRLHLYDWIGSDGNGLLEEQARLMAYGLALTDGRAFYPENRRETRAEFRNNAELDAAVNFVFSQINLSDTMKDLNRHLCSTGPRSERYAPPIVDVYVILDTTVVHDISQLNLQADIIGRLLNGLEFQRGRNVLRVFAGRAGSTLAQLPNRHTPNITASGCAACIAQYLERLRDFAIGYDDETELFHALNETLRLENEDARRTRTQMASPAKVVIYMRLNGEPLRDRESAVNALNQLRLGHPEVTIVGIGERVHLNQLNEHSGTIRVFPVDELERALQTEHRSSESVFLHSPFDDLLLLMGRLPINLRYETSCPPPWSPDVRHHLPPLAGRDDAARFSAGVEPQFHQLISIEPRYFHASDELRIQFSEDGGGHIRVCDVSSGLGFWRDMPHAIFDNAPLQEPPAGYSGVRPHHDCQDTNDYLRTVAFNYSRPCHDGPLSCVALRFAVVGLVAREGANLARTPPKPCRGLFCQKVSSIPYVVTAEGMTCAAAAVRACAALLVAAVATLHALTKDL